MRPRGFANGIDDDIHAFLAGARAHLAADVDIAVVDRIVGAKDGGARQLGIAARRDGHVRADLLRQLQTRNRDSTADSPDKHALAGAKLGTRDEHAVRGERRQRERRRFGGVCAIRDGQDVRGWNHHELGHGPGKVFAKYAEARTERLVAGEAILAGAVAEPRIDDDCITHHHRRHGAADGLDDPHAIRAKYPRRRDDDAGEPLQ